MEATDYVFAAFDWLSDSILAVNSNCFGDCRFPLDTLVKSLQPPHITNRHDAGCGGAGNCGLRG
jgi:hypothetical protein